MGNLEDANHEIDEAIQLAQKQGRAELASYQATRALILAKMNEHIDEGRQFIETAIETNKYLSEFAHIYNCATELYQILGEVDSAKQYALLAYEYAWAEGEPYVLWYDLQVAKKLLDDLKVAHPKLSPYDTENPEKIFMEDEIVAYIEELKAKKAEEARLKAEEEPEETDYFGDEDE